MSEPDVIDVHIHLTRNRAQEKLVFAKPGWPDEWFNCNAEGLPQWLESEGVSHLFAINYIDVNAIIDNRLARMGTDNPERPAAEKELQKQMVDRVRQFNEWVVDYAKTESRVTPFAMVDIGIFFGDQQAMMDEMLAQYPDFRATIEQADPIHHYEKIPPKALALINNRTDPLIPRETAEVLHEKLVPLYAAHPENLMLMLVDTKKPTHDDQVEAFDAGCLWLEEHLLDRAFEVTAPHG